MCGSRNSEAIDAQGKTVSDFDEGFGADDKVSDLSLLSLR